MSATQSQPPRKPAANPIAAGTTPQSVIDFRPSAETKARVADLIRQQKADTLSPDETAELNHFLHVEHVMRLAKARAQLGSLDDAAMGATWRMMNGDREVMALPRAALVRAVMLNHWYHHRGQLTVYLRELGVPVPAIYGPSADENPFA